MAGKRDALIASAEKSIQKGKVDAALKDYLKVLEETPTDLNVLNKVGDLYVRLNRAEESIPYFTKIAEHYSKDGFFLKAIAIWKRINKIDPSRLEVYEKLAELYGKQGLGMEAKSQYQVLADYHTKQSNLPAAIGIYQKMIAGEPANIQLHVRQADLFTQARRVPEALKEYGVVAGMLRERGAFEESVQVYEKALKIAPDNLDILRTFVPLLSEAGRQDEARAVLRRGLETTPRSVPLFIMSADAALNANDMAEARNFATKAQAVEPENEDVLSLLVKIHLKGRRADLAFSAAAPLADAAVRRGEAKKALTLLVPIARAAPDNEDILKKIVEIAHAAGDEPATAPYRSALAEIWRRQGKIAEAADALRICARIAPDIVEYRARLAQLEPLLPQAGRPADLQQHREITMSGITVPASPPPAAAPPRAATPAAPAVPAAPPRAPVPAAPVPAPAPAAPPRTVLPEAAATAPPTVPMARPAPTTAAPERPAPAPPAAPMPPAPPPPPQFTRPSGAGAASFEFDLSDEDLVEEAPPSIIDALPPAARPEDVAARELTDPGIRTFSAPIPAPIPRPASETWASIGETSLSAAEAIEEFESRHSQEPARPEHAPSFDFTEPAPGPDAVEELTDSAEIPILPSPGPAAGTPSFSSIPDFDLAFDVAAPHKAPASQTPLPTEDLAFAATSLPSRYDVPAVEEEPAAAPAPLVQAVLADAAVEEALVEAEVFRKYGLLDKAVEQLKAAVRKNPDALKVRERLFELYVEQGKRPAARREAELLKERYREDGREDRIRAIEALIGSEPLVETPPPPEMPALPEIELPKRTPSGLFKRVSAADVPEIELPKTTPSGPFKRVSAAEIEIPFAPPRHKPKEPEKAAPITELPQDLLETLESLSEPAPTPISEPPAPGLPDLEIVSPSPPHTPTAREPFGVPEEIAPPAPLEPEIIAEIVPVPPTAQELEEAAPEAVSLAPEHEVPAPALEPAVSSGPLAEELSEIDFCLEQGMVVDASERLQTLEARYPGDPELAARRARLEGTSGPVSASAAPLGEILSDDLESVLDAELGRALTDEMARDSGVFAKPQPEPEPPAGPPVDESGLFSDEAEFFNFAEELQTELKQEATLPQQPEMGGPGQEVSLEEIFREFKKGVEQQLSPEDYETHYNLGIAYKEMMLTDEAIGEFQLAAKDPLHAVECCSMLGLCFLEKGLPQLAIKWYRKGLEAPNIREDDRLGLLYDLANVYQDVGDRENAYKAFLDIYGSNASYRDVGDRLKELANA